MLMLTGVAVAPGEAIGPAVVVRLRAHDSADAAHGIRPLGVAGAMGKEDECGFHDSGFVDLAPLSQIARSGLAIMARGQAHRTQGGHNLHISAHKVQNHQYCYSQLIACSA